MSYTSFDAQQQLWQNPQYNPQQWAQFHPQGQQAFGQPIGMGMANGLGQAAFGAPYGAFGAQPYGQTGIGGWGAGGFGGQGTQRQLSPQDVSDVVRQLVPLLPQVIAQAQQPHAAFAYNPYGQSPYGQTMRTLTPQDVNDVVRAILPALPQIVGMLQGQSQFPSAPAHWLGAQGGLGQAAFGQSPATQYPFAQTMFPQQQGIGQTQQRQLSPQDIGEVARQLAGVIPQVIGNLQARQAWMN